MIPVRDLVFTISVLATLPFCLARPWVGILVWSWLAYMNPHRLTWDFAHDLPFAQWVAIATLAGFVFTTDRKPFFLSRETLTLAALWVWFACTTVFAMYPETAWTKFFDVSKILLMAFMSIPLLQDRRRLRLILLVIAGSFGFYGLKGGVFALATGGQWMVLGPPGSFFEANTELAIVLNMALPILLYLSREEPRRWLRLGLRTVFFFTILAVPFTYSRGGVLGLVVVLGVLFWKSRRRLLLFPVVALGLAGVVLFAPAAWVGRMQSVGEYNEDESAQRRFMSWRLGLELALDRPVVAGGFTAFLHRATYDIYVPEYPEGLAHNAHSIYFNLLGEHGWIGLGIFVLLFAFCFRTVYDIRRLARSHPQVAWAGNYAHAIQASLIAYLATGTFISVAYFDLAYQLVILVPLVRVVALQELAAQAEVALPAVTPVDVGLPRRAGA